MNSYRINTSEIIIDPFWDPKISTLHKWKIYKNEAFGMEITNNWCDAAFKYKEPGNQGICLKMARDYDQLDIKEYDSIICSISALLSSWVWVYIKVKTENGIRETVVKCLER